jgi:ankyrin repeat protein
VKWLPEPDNYTHIIDNADTVQALVDGGANVNSHIGNALNRSTPLIAAADLMKWKTVKLLLDHNADVNTDDLDCDTALMMTAERGADTDIIEEILKRGADINAGYNSGRSVLALAISQADPSEHYTIEKARRTVAFLLQHGAWVKKDLNGVSMLSYAWNNWHDPQLIRILKKAGAEW